MKSFKTFIKEIAMGIPVQMSDNSKSKENLPWNKRTLPTPEAGQKTPIKKPSAAASRDSAETTPENYNRRKYTLKGQLPQDEIEKEHWEVSPNAKIGKDGSINPKDMYKITIPKGPGI